MERGRRAWTQEPCWGIWYRRTEFNLPISQWLRLFEDSGLEVVTFYEIRSHSPTEEARFDIDAAWAFEYPSEQAWRLRKR